MEKLKEMLNKDKKTSNLVLIGILLVIILISMNYIFNDDTISNGKSTMALSENIDEVTESVEKRLANIISKIQGVETASVMISYSSTEKIVPVYDTKEDVDTTTEEDRTSTKKTVEKTVAYEGDGSSKSALLESKETAEATGAIVVVDGNISENVELQIKEAVSMVTNVPLHKIQIFVN